MAQQASELDDLFSDLIQEQGITPTAGTPPAEPITPEIVEEEDIFAPPIEEPTVEDPAPSAVEEPTKLEDEPNEVDVTLDDFIDDLPAPVTKSEVNWSEITKDLGVETPIKSKEDLSSYISNLKSQANNAKADLGNIPPALAEAVEIAKQNGDYLSFLDVSARDYASEDPVALFEEEVASLFFDKDDNFDEDGYNNYLDRIDDVDKKLRGKQIQSELISIQGRQKQIIQQRAAEQREANLRKLDESMAKFEGVGSTKATQKIKSAMLNDIASQKFLSDLGISANGNHNWDKVIDNYFKAKYFDAIQKYSARDVKAATQRQILDGVTNSSVKRSAAPQNVAESSKKNPFDLYLESLTKS